MTREEQMWKTVEQEHGELSRREAFITLSAMEWADKTMIEKACKWLRANIDLYADTRRSFSSNYQEVYLTDNFETEFRKAMEEEV